MKPLATILGLAALLPITLAGMIWVAIAFGFSPV